MVGRFCRYYTGYTADTALAEPWSRFCALSKSINALQAEEDLRTLRVMQVAAHPGEKGRAYNALVRELRKDARVERKLSTIMPGLTPFTSREGQPGEIQRLRERQKAADERLRAEWLARQQASQKRQGQ